MSPQRLGGSAPHYNDLVSSSSAQQIASADFPTRWGQFRIYGFRLTPENGKPEEAVFGSLRCDCRQQLELSLSLIAGEGAGILIYEQQEGRGIGLMPKLQAYELQDSGLDTVEANVKLGFKADHREFELPAQILKSLGVSQVRLLSNNPDKVSALVRAGIEVVERVPCEVTPSAHAQEYLNTKRDKMGHLLREK